MSHPRRTFRRVSLGLLTLLCLARPGYATIASEQPQAEQTLSPYFFMPKANEGVDALPLKATRTQVDIAGVIADVKITQVYSNAGPRPLEAIYVFPGSTRAAVYGMKMTIGERVQIAKIHERQAAQATYQAAKSAGKSALLLEQQRPNVFQMHVANIMPGDTITVELAYTELLVPTEGVYTLVYPTVVGPRYANQPVSQTPASERWVANPYLKEGTAVPYTFELTTVVAAGVPIQDLTCSSHEVKVAYDGPDRATITLADAEKHGGNRDYVLKYRLQGGQITTGLLLSQGDDENFFLLMMQPPQRLATALMPPREYIFIVDVSGSMHGFPLDVSKQLLTNLLGGLRPQDTFNMLLFAGSSELFAERSVAATPDNMVRARKLLERQQGGGSTELLPALRRALQLPQAEHSARTIVIATDGYVNVEADAFAVVRDNLQQANVFTFGIGSSVNRFLIEGLARAGMGEPFVVTQAAEASVMAEKFRAYVQAPVLTDIHVTYQGVQVYDVEPPSLPDLFAERPVILFGKWRGAPQGTMTVQGFSGEQTYQQTINVQPNLVQPTHAALRYLWARHRIATLDDDHTLQPRPEHTAHITRLGLQYNLLTRFTSFVAVDDVVREAQTPAQTVLQPLPLPKGVSNHAVGGHVPTTPEPETYLLMAVVGVILLWGTYRRRQDWHAALRRLWTR